MRKLADNTICYGTLSTKLLDAIVERVPGFLHAYSATNWMSDRTEEDVLAYKVFPQAHWQRIHSTNPLERLNKEIKRRTSVIGIFPDEATTARLTGALMLEQDDEWAITRALYVH
jgi:transposase-like protein